jgi:nicotinate phosphoribosyltransferase
MSNLGMHTDQYELTMLEAAMQSGLAEQRTVFEVFSRSLRGYRYGVVAGTERALDAIQNFHIEDNDLKWLVDCKIIKMATAKWLESYRFHGRVSGYREGDLYFPYSPIFTVEGTFAEAVLLETVVLSMMNFDTSVAGLAARVRAAAGEGKTLIEMASRRTHEEAAISVARSAYLAGFDATSNLLAGQRYGIPTTGTSAHAFTMGHTSEDEAFKVQVAALGKGTTLLVDTYDVELGIEHAVAAAGSELGAIRIDSGDLETQARRARRELDALGCIDTKIVLSGDLDEFRIAAMVEHGTPAQVFGVGTRLVTGAMSPGMVYKLVAVEHGGEMIPVSKNSQGKATVGGRKAAFRTYRRGRIATEVLSLNPDSELGEELQVVMLDDGQRVFQATLNESRQLLRERVGTLPSEAFELDNYIPVIEAKMFDHNMARNALQVAA